MSAVRNAVLQWTGFGRFRHAAVPAFHMRGDEAIICPTHAQEIAQQKMSKIFLFGGAVAATYIVAGALAYSTYQMADEVPYVVDGGVFGCQVPRLPQEAAR